MISVADVIELIESAANRFALGTPEDRELASSFADATFILKSYLSTNSCNVSGLESKIKELEQQNERLLQLVRLASVAIDADNLAKDLEGQSLLMAYGKPPEERAIAYSRFTEARQIANRLLDHSRAQMLDALS